MRRSGNCILLLVLCAGGCGKESTAQLIENLKAPDPLTRVKAVRTLPERRSDAAQVVPALIGALKDEEADVRRGAAYGLGAFGQLGKEAVPALQGTLQDPDAGVRKAVGIALSLIETKDAPPR